MKLSLNDTWKHCLSMWRWIARQKRAGSRQPSFILKRRWLANHGFEEDALNSDCFFCEYAETHGGKGGLTSEDCVKCPGKTVDEFNCMSTQYHYDRPVAFYNKLVALNRKRLKK